MRNWEGYVRQHLRLEGMEPEREKTIVREIATQLEEFFNDALARGLSEADADDYARRQVKDWGCFESEIRRADWCHARSRLDRWHDNASAGASRQGGLSTMFADLYYDVLFGLRMLRKNPGFTAVAVLTLALGIGANTAIFSVINGVLLQPLPYPDPGKVVRLWEGNPQRGWIRGAASPADYLDWKKRSESFEDMGIFYPRSGNLSGGSEPESIDYALVTPGFLRAFRVPPMLGRLFADEEDLPERDTVAILSYPLWQRAFGGDPEIIGKRLTLDSERLEVVGVMPQGFELPNVPFQLWKPTGMDLVRAGGRGSYWVYPIGRVKDSVSLQQAQAELETISVALENEYPDTNKGFRAILEPVQMAAVAGVRRNLYVLWGAVGLVLLIACVNVANLLLARAAVRGKEMAVRAALGAGRLRILRQLLTESLLLAFAGAGLGVLLAEGGVRLLPQLAAGSLPRVEEVGLDVPVLLFSLGLALLTALFFGLLPAFRAARPDLQGTLREGGRETSGGGRHRLRIVLASAEVALALILLVGAGLLIRSFASVMSVDPGYDSVNLLSLRVEPAKRVTSSGKSLEEFLAEFTEERGRVSGFYQELMDRIETVPGVRSAAAVNRMPLTGNMWGTSVAIEGRSVTSREDMLGANARVVTPGYTSTMGIPLIRGRRLEWSDRHGSLPVVVINEAMAQAYWPGEDPVGQRITSEYPPETATFWFTVVGVVGSVRHNTLTREPRPIVYTAIPQAMFGFFGNWGMDLVIRTADEPLSTFRAVRSEVRFADPDLPVSHVRSMEQVTGDSVARRRFSMLLLGVFASVAFGLAAVGIYGVIAFSVSQRTHEIGIRLALGAQRGDILRMVLGHGMALTLAGVVVGLAGTLALTRYLESLLFGITATDPWTFAGVSALLTAVALLACYIPARRATRVDPMVALRYE